MSTLRVIDATLQVPCDQVTVFSIIKKGSELGFIYFDSDIFERKGLKENQILSNEEAKHKILDHNEINAHEGGAYVEVMFKEIVFMLRMSDKNGMVEVHMGDFHPGWEKPFYGDVEMFDFGKHVELMLTLCGDFALIKLETETY